jgi:gliding motility-associated-like protein
MNRHSLIISFEKRILKPKFCILFLLTCFFIRVQTHAQKPSPKIISQKTIGGSLNETLNCTYPTTDGGYILGGQTTSSNGDISGSRKGLSDALIVKIDATGNIEFQVNLGGSRDESVTSIKETSDQGFIILGTTASTDGDFSTNHGGNDIFVIKISKIGSIQWNKCFGGTLDEKSGEVVASSEGGYLFTGNAKSFNGDLTGQSPIDADGWIVKITNTGTISWDVLPSGPFTDICKAAKQLPNKNYVVVGNVGNASGTNQREDIFTTLINPTGNIIGQRSMGGTRQDLASALEVTPDGGFVILGKTNSNNGTITKNQGDFDVWILKMNQNLNLEWQKTFGGSQVDGGNETDVFGGIQATDDGGYVFTSSTNSKNGDIELPSTAWVGSQARVWVVKLNCKQEIQWQKVLGGNAGDFGVFVKQIDDKGYFISANTNSNDGDVSGSKGSQDFWLINLSPDPKLKPNLAASGPLEICEGNMVKLNADIGPLYNYQWFKDGTKLPTEAFSRITITKSGDYKVIITPKDCPKPQADTSAKVIVNPKPKLGLPKDTTFCKSPMQLNANNISGAVYQWSSGETLPSISPTSSGTYKLNVKAGGCEVDSSVNVKVSSSPVITLSSKIEACFDVNTPYILSVGADLSLNYRWLPNGETAHVIAVSNEGTYTVKATNSDGCVTEKSVLMVQKCVSKILAPNIFTPNGDSDNDVFWISAEDVTDYQLKIYNRWGEMVFMAATETAVWDGTFNSQKAPEGTYTWQLSYKNTKQPLEVLSHGGTVLLVR